MKKEKGKSRRPLSSDPHNMSDFGSNALEKRQSAIKSILEESDGGEDELLERKSKDKVRISRMKSGRYYDDKIPVSPARQKIEQKKNNSRKKSFINYGYEDNSGNDITSNVSQGMSPKVLMAHRNSRQKSIVDEIEDFIGKDQVS